MSDIWNEFEKIALDQGLITVAEEDQREQEDPAKMPAHYDSVAEDAVALLYGVKPDSIFDKDKTIIEVAHPETAIAGRAYDAMNAVIENEHQRHDMMAYIALKMPNGHLTQRRYVAAKQDLVNSLVRSAFTLDNRDEEDLMALADSCADRVQKRAFKKEALAPLAIAAAASVLLGGAAYIMYGPQTAQNVYANSQQVLAALDNLSTQPYANAIRSDVQKLMNMAESVYAVKNQLGSVTSVDVALSAAQSEKHKAAVESINNRIRAYVTQLQKVQRAIPQWVSKINLISSTSTEESSDIWAKLKELTDYISPFQSDAEDLVDKLWGKENIVAAGRAGGLYEAIQNDISAMQKAISAAKQEVQQKAAELEVAQENVIPQPEKPDSVDFEPINVKLPRKTPEGPETQPTISPAVARAPETSTGW